MEKELKQLFDFQKFAHNERLDVLIKETESREKYSLSDNELSIVSAAGDPFDNKLAEWKDH